MTKDPAVLIKHMLECIELLERYTAGVSLADFLSSEQVQDAVIRRVEIIGEAAKNIPDNVREKGTGIPWKRITGMRDVLVHDYLGVDLELVWRVAKNEAVELKRNITTLLESLS